MKVDIPILNITLNKNFERKERKEEKEGRDYHYYIFF